MSPLRVALVVVLAASGSCSPPPGEPEKNAGDSNSKPAAILEAVMSGCPDADRSEAAFRALEILEEHGPILPSSRQRDALKRFVQRADYRHWCHDRFRDTDLRMTGPILPVASRTGGGVATTAFSTHSRVRVYYSNSMLKWMADGREGPVPDGAVMVKEMHPWRPDADTASVDGHAVMVKDSRSTRDGWLWYLHYELGNKAYTLPFEGAQYGNNFCLSCHAAATSESTFAEWGNLLEEDVPTYVTLGEAPSRAFGTTHGRIPAAAFGLDAAPVEAPAASSPIEDWRLGRCASRLVRNPTQEDFFGCVMYAPLVLPHPAATNREFANWFGQVIRSPMDAAAPLPRQLPLDLLHDHLPPGPDATGWLTASTCYACHDGADLLNGTNAEMTVALGDHGGEFDHLYPLSYCWQKGGCEDQKPDKLALSQYGEWSGSLMAVSARDPVFRAQLESELARYPERATETTTLCLSCHAPAGKRFDQTLAGDLEHTYADATARDPALARFGALARDGVTCAVCHRIADENLGRPESFVANFSLEPADTVNGPPLAGGPLQTDPMQTALGVTPRFAEHVRDAGLCGTCHMVDTPVYDSDKGIAHEQTTYLEWRNSSFAQPDSPEHETCQTCHMPDTNPLKDAPTEGAIANYEDSEFPFVPNRKRAELVDTVERPGYRRHTLVGINVFTMSLFQQFPYLLGSHTFSPTRQFVEIVPPRALAMNEAIKLARESTADISAETTRLADGRFAVDVQVENLTGHKFPSGVGFRRAFLTVEALDKQGRRVWCSGCASDIGVLTNTTGQPLPNEVALQSRDWQPDYTEIDRDDQVQIYETRHTNAKGELTTSFVELNAEVKDNRLLPRGWDFDGYPEYEMNPVAASVEARPELDRVRYLVPGGKTARIKVALYYQALPPYYLLDRMSLLRQGRAQDHPETQRLLHMLLRLRMGDPATHGSRAIDGWRLKVGTELTLDVS